MGEEKISGKPGFGYLAILIVGIFLAVMSVRLFQSGFSSAGIRESFSLESLIGKAIVSILAALAAWVILRRLGKRMERKES